MKYYNMITTMHRFSHSKMGIVRNNKFNLHGSLSILPQINLFINRNTRLGQTKNKLMLRLEAHMSIKNMQGTLCILPRSNTLNLKQTFWIAFGIGKFKKWTSLKCISLFDSRSSLITIYCSMLILIATLLGLIFIEIQGGHLVVKFAVLLTEIQNYVKQKIHLCYI